MRRYDVEPITMYRYGDEWTSVERGYPHQDADERAAFARIEQEEVDPGA
jgi:hypothetical protein